MQIMGSSHEAGALCFQPGHLSFSNSFYDACFIISQQDNSAFRNLLLVIHRMPPNEATWTHERHDQLAISCPVAPHAQGLRRHIKSNMSELNGIV